MIHPADPDWLTKLRELAQVDPLIRMGLQMADRDWVPLVEALGRVCAHQADELRHYREIVFRRRPLSRPSPGQQGSPAMNGAQRLFVLASLRRSRRQVRQLIVDASWWNANRTDQPPMDLGADLVWLRAIDHAIADLRTTGNVRPDLLNQIIAAGEVSIAVEDEAPAPLPE